MERMTDWELEIIVANCLAGGNTELLERATKELVKRGKLENEEASKAKKAS